MSDTFWNKAAVIACTLVVVFSTAQHLADGTLDWLDYAALLFAGGYVGFIIAHTIYAPRVINVYKRRVDE